ncbi:hypothetical protein RCL_jg6750.t1 [Rhizophagus clarus]|uniref:Uncharacterized protein n=1 Tax=Rhizophagus clarus TaxID=94130 RepID=A0A8H3QNL8_9GLOM|nr:hypothetical protein RCL_jg6750.t1 [Rhizophagus clarus]
MWTPRVIILNSINRSIPFMRFGAFPMQICSTYGHQRGHHEWRFLIESNEAKDTYLHEILLFLLHHLKIVWPLRLDRKNAKKIILSNLTGRTIQEPFLD